MWLVDSLPRAMKQVLWTAPVQLDPGQLHQAISAFGPSAPGIVAECLQKEFPGFFPIRV